MGFISYQEVAKRYNDHKDVKLQINQEYYEWQKKFNKRVDLGLSIASLWSKALSVLGIAKSASLLDDKKQRNPFVDSLPMTLLNCPENSKSFYRDIADGIAIAESKRIDPFTFNLGVIRNPETKTVIGYTDGKSATFIEGTDDIGLIEDGLGKTIGSVTGIKKGEVQIYIDHDTVSLDENGYLPGTHMDQSTDLQRYPTALENDGAEDKILLDNDIERKETDIKKSSKHTQRERNTHLNKENLNNVCTNTLADLDESLLHTPVINNETNQENIKTYGSTNTNNESQDKSPFDFRDGNKPRQINIPDSQNIQILPYDSVSEIIQKIIDHLENGSHPQENSNLLHFLTQEYINTYFRNDDPWKLVEPQDLKILSNDQFIDLMKPLLESMSLSEKDVFINDLNSVINKDSTRYSQSASVPLFPNDVNLHNSQYDEKTLLDQIKYNNQQIDSADKTLTKSNPWDMPPIVTDTKMTETYEYDLQDNYHSIKTSAINLEYNNPIENSGSTLADIAEGFYASKLGYRSQELISDSQNRASSYNSNNKSNLWDLQLLETDTSKNQIDFDTIRQDGIDDVGHENTENLVHNEIDYVEHDHIEYISDIEIDDHDIEIDHPGDG